MHLFRTRLILTLIATITAISLVFTYFDVLAHRHVLRMELSNRSRWIAVSVEPKLLEAFAVPEAEQGSVVSQAATGTGAMGLALYDAQGRLLQFVGPQAVMRNLPPQLVEKSLRKNSSLTAFGHDGAWRWLETTLPLWKDGQRQGALALVTDASYIHRDALEQWKRSFWRIALFVVAIVAVTLLMVRWFLLQPMTRAVEKLRGLRMNAHAAGEEKDRGKISDLNLFQPLVNEVETMAEHLVAAREAASIEARLRDAGEHVWTAERLAVRMREQAASSKIFAVSNREPYVHVHKGKQIVCQVPASGLVTAIEPVLRVCDGVWVASGSGDADAETVDERGRVRVPPDDPRYTLRRVWLSEEEQQRYYEGFANEGIWPLCHIAHTRPIFRADDWECYRKVNERFARALLEEMEGVEQPVVFVQDYHFALLPRLIKAERPEARVAIFWHIPWPNPEAFGICPWQSELIDGLLGADLIGFHIPLHCNNFLATVDRAVEARIDRERHSVERRGHASVVRSYPISVALEGVPGSEASEPASSENEEKQERARQRVELLAEFGVKAESLAVGVERLDYTKGIEERLLALEQLYENHPWQQERLTLVQIAAPSRTKIPSYAQLHDRVVALAERINKRFKTAHWRPIVLIERQCNHEEVNRWYRVADLCLVTSLHDGMNLVAKEFVAAREDEDGVLVLSKFAGAAVEMRDALIVNPYDTMGVAEAMHEGLAMEREQRRERMRRMRRQVMENNIYRWAAEILGDLGKLRLEENETISSPEPKSGETVLESKQGE